MTKTADITKSSNDYGPAVYELWVDGRIVSQSYNQDDLITEARERGYTITATA